MKETESPTDLPMELVDSFWHDGKCRQRWCAGSLLLLTLDWDPETETHKFVRIDQTPYTRARVKRAYDACRMSDLKR